MTRRIEDILSRALLVRHRTVPRDIVPFSPRKDRRTQPAQEPPHKPGPPNAAAEDLRALCETLVTHTPATAVTDFVTDQVPEPRSALVLACVLQLTDTDEEHAFGGSTPSAPGRPPPRTASTSTTSPWGRATQPTGGTARPTTSNHHPDRPPRTPQPPVQK
ncbi:hypothetical protein AB0D91_47600 [Streptomyces canus]|uniref:hypothetical protein n=1 Tax=Streptomyces canus TaxID=58343 RepID=UPI0033FAD66D